MRMVNVRNLDERIQRHLDDYLQSVSHVLARSGMDPVQAQTVLDDIEIQVAEMLRDRASGSPTEADMRATIAGLDDPESYAQANEVLTGDRQMPTEAVMPDRFSRLAILGAFWAPYFFIYFYLLIFYVRVVPVGPGFTPPGIDWSHLLLSLTIVPLGIMAPFGTTILGWVAVNRIKHSSGKLTGLGLAVADGLFFPLLILDNIIVGLFLLLCRSLRHSWPQQVSRYEGLTIMLFTIAALAVIFWLDYAIIKWTWNRVGSGSKT